MKRLLILCAALFLSSAASAQLLLGVEGGLSVNSYSKDNGLDCNGWKVGAYVGYTFRSNWQIQSGVGYYGNRMGTIKDWSDLRDYAGAEVYKNTLTIPVTVGYKIGGRFISVTPKVGLYVGFGHNAKTVDGDVLDAGTAAGKQLKFNKTDCGLLAGVDIALWKLQLRAAYELGFVNLSDDYPGGKLRNGSFTLTLGFSLFR